MGDNKPATTRTWAVALNGDVWEKPVAPLTAHQRHQKYRIAISKAITVLEDQGFRMNCEPMHTGFSMDKGRVTIDVHLKDVQHANVAHITSHAGYKYEDITVGKARDGSELKKINAKVTYLADQINSKYVLQIGLVAVSSAVPVYVELPDDCEDPERFALKAIFATIIELATKIPALEEAGNAARAALGYAPESVVESPKLLDNV